MQKPSNYVQKSVYVQSHNKQKTLYIHFNYEVNNS